LALIVFYITGHGLGHATRDIEVIKAIAALEPSARIVVRTSAPRWVFEANAPGLIELQPFESDTGVVQLDPTRIDEQASVRRAAAFYADFDRRASDEAAVLKTMRPDVVLGDIPPLAFEAADRAGIPSIAISNFTWDWIYEEYATFERDAPHVVPTIRAAYARTTLALRLPMYGGFEAMAAVVRDIPLIVRRSTRDPEETRGLLGIRDDRPVVLVTLDSHGPELAIAIESTTGRVTVLTSECLVDGLRYPDLVAASDAVLTKPGYGIISECVANGTALLYTSRGRFREYDALVAEAPRLVRCRYIPRDDLFNGRWEDALDALLRQPDPPDHPPLDGAAVAARVVLDSLPS
jgi:L-arabinokinase